MLMFFVVQMLFYNCGCCFSKINQDSQKNLDFLKIVQRNLVNVFSQIEQEMQGLTQTAQVSYEFFAPKSLKEMQIAFKSEECGMLDDFFKISQKNSLEKYLKRIFAALFNVFPKDVELSINEKDRQKAFEFFKFFLFIINEKIKDICFEREEEWKESYDFSGFLSLFLAFQNPQICFFLKDCFYNSFFIENCSEGILVATIIKQRREFKVYIAI